ncbi:uncharacterized protein K444DRAFT_618542 [Hyaloscypha bicolor E]|uniref:Uncharacterized protein n=1 Tax=Hyaloscypha bicolor E TaxID=1095630 RepID=A0A2J6STG9_9HELO|nr:uncharacterized protein K444DRAFT_618542 [Hyaloscypha bicolor E]PMD54078.1 hypothetical protein K444DRAFT_618542 [Hyaloscypha bicolor E]
MPPAVLLVVVAESVVHKCAVIVCTERFEPNTTGACYNGCSNEVIKSHFNPFGSCLSSKSLCSRDVVDTRHYGINKPRIECAVCLNQNFLETR